MIDDEIKILYDKCILFNEFMAEKGNFPKELIGAFAESNRLLKDAYLKRKIKPLKVASNDIDDQIIRHMSLSMALELKLLFKEKLNVDFDVFEKARINSIQKILKRGKINDSEEYELLLNRIDEIYMDRDKTDELGLLKNILINYKKINK